MDSGDSANSRGPRHRPFPSITLGPRHLNPPPSKKMPIVSAARRGMKDFKSQEALQRRVYEAKAARARTLPGVVVSKRSTGAGAPEVGGGGWTPPGSPGVGHLAWVGQAVRLKLSFFSWPRPSDPTAPLTARRVGTGPQAPCLPCNPHGLPPAAASAATQDEAGISADISVSLLSVIVTFCGIVLLGVSLFVSWKLCWVPWRDKGGSAVGGGPLRKDLGPGVGLAGLVGGGGHHLGAGLGGHPLLGGPHHHAHTAHHPPFAELLEPGGLGGSDPPEPSYLDMDSYPEAAAAAVAAGVKPSQTSPELPTEGGAGSGLLLLPPSGGGLPSAQSHQQVTSLAPTTRYPALPRPLTQQTLTPQPDPGSEERPPALPLPLPGGEEKAKLIGQIKPELYQGVHRKTLNPVFNETFQFAVPLAELAQRKLHFSVYDFDRFSRHDLIGQVVLDNLLELAEQPPDRPLWRDIVEGGSEKADLGELNFSLCYLPTAGRLTVTIIKASNLKAMDLTGFSDPYVKASLISEGRRLKKRKTSIKKNTLNPTYNEALVFDVAPESVENVGLSIAVVDYDCIGHNEVIGVCRVGPDAADPHGREHWAEMLANPRKPVEHWHQLVEEKTLTSFTKGNRGLSEKENSE
ncbi:synaptotagmin-3 [Orycteropus afer afer]|uniref:Synaptotagmin-3 n=1 Tax=Orycteropus afer afer TaxID=1230840 RepID=A0A8B7B6M1_ORYAF|nr:synaptotagmin-3 [Orycteropus afer afer]